MRQAWVRAAGLIGGLFWALPSTAIADDIRGPVVTADGYVLIAIERAGDGSDFRARLEKPSSGLNIHQGKVDFDYRESGKCHDIFSKLNRDGESIMTQTRRCPTPDGWQETLVGSGLYESYDVRWTLLEYDGKVQLQWELKAYIPGVAPIVLNYHLGEEMKRALRTLGASD